MPRGREGRTSFVSVRGSDYYKRKFLAVKRMSYTLSVNADTKKTVNLVVTDAGEHIVATRGSSYHLVAHNKTEHLARVTVHIGGKLLGTWIIKPATKLKIDEHMESVHMKKSTLVFDTSSFNCSDVCERYNIEAMFHPGDVTVVVPIVLCDHVVNR